MNKHRHCSQVHRSAGQVCWSSCPCIHSRMAGGLGTGQQVGLSHFRGMPGYQLGWPAGRVTVSYHCVGQPGLVHTAPGQFQEKEQLWSSWGPASSLLPHPFEQNKSWGQTQGRNELHLFMEEQEDHTARGLDMGSRRVGLFWQHDIHLTPVTGSPVTFGRRRPIKPPYLSNTPTNSYSHFWQIMFYSRGKMELLNVLMSWGAR